MSYITPAGRAALASYKYKGEDRSLLYKYVLSPWAQFCVDYFTPESFAPNTITAIGLGLQLIAYLAMFGESPNFATPISPGNAFLAAICLFLYSTLDNMDGKQARKIGASSPLGLLFDHGCDSINTGMLGSLIFAMAVGPGGTSWIMYALWGAVTTAFFLNTWEEYHIREFILPLVNGPSEGLVTMTGLLALTGIYGQQMWKNPPPEFLSPVVAVLSPLTRLIQWVAGADSEAVFTTTDLTTTASALFLAITCVGNTVNVWRHVVAHSSTPQLDLLKALGRTTPIIVMHAAAFLWFSHGAFKDTIEAHPHIFYMTLGALFADFTSKLMVSHVADQPYRVDYTGLAIFAFGPVLATLAQYQIIPYTIAELFNEANFWLFLSFVVATTQLTLFMYYSITEIAKSLDIDVFDPRKQVARSQAAKAAAAREG